MFAFSARKDMENQTDKDKKRIPAHLLAYPLTYIVKELKISVEQTHTYTTITKKRTNSSHDRQYTFVVRTKTIQRTLLEDLLEPIDLLHPVIFYQAPSPKHIRSMVYNFSLRSGHL